MEVAHAQAVNAAEAGLRRIEVGTMGDYRPEAGRHPPTLMVGYPQMPDPAIRVGVRELAGAVRAARAEAP